MSSTSLLVSSTLVFSCLACGCGGVVDPVADTDAASTGDVDPSTGIFDATTGTAASTTTAATMAADTTGAPDESSGSTAAETGSFLHRPDGGTTPAGICVGLSSIGYMATIHGADDAPVDPTCSTTADACGGDVVGTWTIQSHCGLDALPNFFAQDCPGSAMTFLASDVQGARTFADNGSFTVETSLALDVELELDAMECFGIDCETFGAIIDQEDNNVAASCSQPEGGACTCLMTITSDDATDGTWEIVDDALVLTVDGQAGDPIPFCAEGDRLALWETLHESQAFPETFCADASDCEDALGDAYEEWICVE